ncbi:MAG: hypothetical protein C0460_10950 [Methylibium sp.]|nr:hypothetical protein [Methylibium sp.]
MSLPAPSSDAGVQRYELWQDRDSLSFFLSTDEAMRRLLEPAAVKVWECLAGSWDEAQTLKHEHLGWEPYRPWR